MTNKSWKKIWNKNAKQIKPKNLNDLLKLNGHSSATSEINRNKWKKYTNYFIKKYNIRQNQSVLEIGRGCGAFLYFFSKKRIKCFGIDNSKELIRVAKKFFYNYASSNKLNISISNQTLIKKENSKFRFNIFLNYEKK